MGKWIDRIIGVFCLLVLFGFLSNHGLIDFGLVDWGIGKGKEVIESPEVQEIGNEVKDLSVDTAKTLVDETEKRVRPALDELKQKNEEQEEEKKKSLYELIFGDRSKSPSQKDNDTEGTEDVSEPESSLTKASLIRVVDGDTIIVDFGDGEDTRVRLIGIDTPESVHPDAEKNSELGRMASDYTKSLLSGVSSVYIQFDTDTTDKYGRTLAYVWLKDIKDTTSVQNVSNYMVNGILVTDGYAVDKVFEPNVMYADIFAELREEAEENQRGLWGEGL